MELIQITLWIDDDVILPVRYTKIVLITIWNQIKFRCRERTEMVTGVLKSFEIKLCSTVIKV